MSETHQRKCWNCGNVAEHERAYGDAVRCKRYGSMDTRRIKSPEPIPFRQLPPTPENLERIGWKIDRDSGPSGVSLESLGGVTIWYCLKNWNISDHEAEIQIPTPATMGDVLDWHSLLKIPVKEVGS